MRKNRIKYFIYIPLFIITLSFFSFINTSYAQNGLQRLFTISTDSVFFAENESLIALVLTLENKSMEPFNGKIELKTATGITLVGNETITINIAADSKIYYPIRLSVNKNVPAGETLINLMLINNNDQIQYSFSSKLIIALKKQIQLTNYRPTELMQSIGDSLTISTLLRNQGNVQEKVTITSSFPNLTGGNELISKQIVLDAFQDSIVTFKRIITKELLQIERYTVNIAALYENGDLINNVMVNVQNISGNRTYTDPAYQGYGFNSYNNKISISGRSLFTDNEALQLNGQGNFSLFSGNLGFNIDGYYYTKNNSRPLLTNTYLNYEIKNKGITIGNINENLETFINGRGVKVYVNNEESSQLELAIVDKSYNLLGNEYKLNGGNGYTSYAKAYFKNEYDRQYSGSVLYDRLPLDNSENIILANQYQLILKKRWALTFNLGGGLTKLLDNSSASFKPSINIGNKLDGYIGKYNVNSNNLYSSAYYPGIRRGVLQLDERISRIFNKTNIWLTYNYYDYNPKYFEGQYLNSFNTTNSRLEIGTNFPLSNNLNFSLAAKKHVERSNIMQILSFTDFKPKLRSFKLSETISWRSQNNQHNIYLSLENGFFKSPLSQKNEFQIRTSASWNYRSLSLNSYFQKGSFVLAEVYNNSLLPNNKSIYRINISPSIRKDFFAKKLRVEVNINYNHDAYSGTNWMYSGSTNYIFSKIFSGFISTYFYNYNHSPFSSVNSSYSVFQTGITYNLPNSESTGQIKKGNMKFFIFYDNNTNGIFDEGDSPAENKILSIGNVSFMTLSNGSIEYKKVPYGEYSLEVPSQEWFAVVPPLINLQSRDFTLNIPLQRTGKITGSFYYNYDKNVSMEITDVYTGLKVFVIDKNGQRIEALSNSNGDFTLFVPIGEYDFLIDENLLPKDVFVNTDPQKIIVSAGESTVIPAIELNVKQKTIEIKRFSSE